jgi:hypothetical protein
VPQSRFVQDALSQAAGKLRLGLCFAGARLHPRHKCGNINAALAAEGALSAREILFRQPVQARRKRYAILAVSRIAEKLELRIGLSL